MLLLVPVCAPAASEVAEPGWLWLFSSVEDCAPEVPDCVAEDDCAPAGSFKLLLLWLLWPFDWSDCKPLLLELDDEV